MPLKDFLHRHHKGLFIAGSGVVLLALLSTGTPMVIDYDQLAHDQGPTATRLLDATGFPHATDQPTETYCFAGLGAGGNETESFRIDWHNHTVAHTHGFAAECQMRAQLPPGAFNSVVSRLSAMSQGEVVDGASKLALTRDLLFRTHVEIEGKNQFGVFAWKLGLLNWASATIIVPPKA